MTKIRSESGFSLMEVIVATAVLMAVSAIVTGAMLQLTKAQATIWNRTEMHSGIRGATELLQQEVGHAGRVGVPQTITLTQAINPIGGVRPAARDRFGSSPPKPRAAPCDLGLSPRTLS